MVENSKEVGDYKESLSNGLKRGGWTSSFGGSSVLESLQLELVSRRLELESFSSDSSSEGKILGHDSDSLSMDGAEIGIFEESDKIGFSSLLESQDR